MIAPRFLLITDSHFADEGSELKLDDLSKTSVRQILHPTREAEIDKLFGRIADELRRNGEMLDGVLFGGDAQRRGLTGGHRILFDLIIQHFGERGISPKRIVATPGNHDVKKWSDPSSRERYQAFTEVWKEMGCVVPWLDGVDDRYNYDPSDHFLAADDKRWVVFPLNSSNWSQVQVAVPESLSRIWSDIPQRLSDDLKEQESFRKAFDDLLSYDMAHVSDAQLEVLRAVMANMPSPHAGPQLRILLMHHHLRAPGLRVELKAFENVSNLQQIRGFIAQSGVNLVLHGHKHEHAVHFEHFDGLEREQTKRVAVLSAGAIDNGRDEDAARILSVSGLPYTPTLHSQRFGLARSGLDAPVVAEPSIRLWSEHSLAGGPAVVQGVDFNEVYARASHAALQLVPRGTLVVHLDLPPTEVRLDLPDGYPEASDSSPAERLEWLKEIVGWWQLPHSHRDKNFPYPHGSRLRRYGGVTDQIDRLGAMLESTRSSPTLSSRALAILVDPIRDFLQGSDKEAFPSFTMLQLKKRSEGGDNRLDIIGFYRAQEFSQWWPVNIAELRAIQVRLSERAGTKLGRITTITTEARLDEKAPGQVHVPILDRWLDQAPENIFLLACLLVGQIKDHPQEKVLFDQWRQSLNDLTSVARARSADGSPISSQGLKALRNYIIALCPDGRGRPEFFPYLETLVDQTESFETSAKDIENFERWARAINRAVPEILNATAQISAHLRDGA